MARRREIPTRDWEVGLRRLAEARYPDECCALVVDGRLVPCVNVSPTPRTAFRLDARVQLCLERALARGADVAICHSHPDGAARPSDADLTGALLEGEPRHAGARHVIVAVVRGAARDVREFALVGGRFVPATAVSARPRSR